jgi:cytochrome c-type biogenesis protein CcsB
MKYSKFLFSPVFMGILFVLFAIAMAIATFIENDFGSSASYSIVYGSKWFELILLLLAINMTGRMIILKLYRKDKFPVFVFHLSFVLMIAGAAITRYSGWEGSIHIREGEEQNKVFSTERYIDYSVFNKDGKLIAGNSEKYNMSSVSAGNYKKKIKTGENEYELILARIIPNATETITETPDGEPIISFMATLDMRSMETITLKKGQSKTVHGLSMGFDSADSTDITIKSDSASFYLSSFKPVTEISMMTRESKELETGSNVLLKTMQVLSVNDLKLVPQQMILSGTTKVVSVDPAKHNTGQNAFIFHVFRGTQSGTISLWNTPAGESVSGTCTLDDNTFEVSYGPKMTVLPFALKLNDFILERYPGSTSPSGYKSDVVLLDRSANIEMPFLIFMNNILKYNGYRFYQSSYDQDEKGTILSVNHDPLGMMVTYAGYGLLIVFIILSLFIRNSLFRKINPGHWSSSLRKAVTFLIFFMVVSGLNPVEAQKLIPDKSASEEFGKVLVQDQKGRTKPLFTLSNDILRKVTRENKFEKLTSMQVFLGIYLDFNNWKDVPLIRISNGDLQRLAGIRGDKASFSDLVDLEGNGSYKLSEQVNNAYAKSPGDRSKMDKEIMKVDERVNIIYMIYQGDFLKLFPLKDTTKTWGTNTEALKNAVNKEDSIYLTSILPLLDDAVNSGNQATVKQISGSIIDYQSKFAEYDLPSKSKIKAELLYYRLNIFEKLFPYYATIGLVMLIGLIVMVLRGRKEISLFVKVMGWLLFAGFIMHTFGLGLRWYISGHSPMSNGYESMLFISWVTVLAGFIFSSKSTFALSATGILASMTLMVAHLSFMDPEITNLVPVLKSYWLTIHVSIITGSYGFLGLGAILALISMILILLSNDKNRTRISAKVDELTVINYKSLTLGLYFLTIGTFIGAIWANESWGRYWGWDPKETWSLITIIIYSIVIHSRNIPGMKDIFTFNVIALFAFSSVLMTYFGVNYYLSGLHSYASGDPVPVPAFVYITVIVLAALSFMANSRYQGYKKADEIKAVKR